MAGRRKERESFWKSAKKGTLCDGADADVTIIDPHRAWKIDAEQFQSKSRNCPFSGWDLKGRTIASIVAGEVRWQSESR